MEVQCLKNLFYEKKKKYEELIQKEKCINESNNNISLQEYMAQNELMQFIKALRRIVSLDKKK